MSPKIKITSALAIEALTIAERAGVAIMDIYEQMQEPSISMEKVLLAPKADESPLTRADLVAHQIISQGLRALTPTIEIVSEEDEGSFIYRLPKGDFWLIDPLDGTKEFLAQNGEFTVNIALVRDGRAVLGVVLAPALKQAYWAVEASGAFRLQGSETERIQVKKPIKKDQVLRVLASKNHMNSDTRHFIDRLGEHELLQAGSSLKFCRIAEGLADVYPRLGPTCEWDTAAAQIIVEEAGGYVSSMDAKPLVYGKTELLNPHFVVSSIPTSLLLGSSE